jgi:hypothetical protein
VQQNQPEPRRSPHRHTGASLLAIAVALPLMIAAATKAPEQPIPFSHKQHAPIAPDCQMCHRTLAKAERAGLPQTEECMACHSAIQKNSPAIEKLTSFYKEKTRVPWARVYRLPDFVFFSHAKHMAGKVTCTECHGPVERRDVLAAEVLHNMKTCMDCHRVRKASNNCHSCHELGE